MQNNLSWREILDIKNQETSFLDCVELCQKSGYDFFAVRGVVYTANGYQTNTTIDQVK